MRNELLILYKIIFLLVLFVASFSSISPTPIKQKTDIQSEIEKLYYEGIRLHEENRLDEALIKFTSALEKCRESDLKEVEMIIDSWIASIYESKKQVKLAHKYYQDALRISRYLGDKEFEAQMLLSLSMYYILVGKYSDSLEVGEKALKIARDLKNTQWEYYAMSSLGNANVYLGNFTIGLEHFNNSLALSRETQNKEWEQIALEYIANLYFNCFGNSEMASFYMGQLLKIAQEGNSPESKMSAFEKLGQLNKYQENYSKALIHFEKALNIAQKMKDKQKVANFSALIAFVYTGLGQYKEALKFNKNALEFYINSKNPWIESLILYRIGDNYGRLEKWQEALIYIQSALDIAREIADEESIAACTYLKGQALFYLGFTKQSLSHFKRTIHLIESMRKQIKSIEHRDTYSEERRHVYDHMIINLYTLYQQEHDESYLKETFTYVEMAKARALLDILTEAKTRIEKDISKEDLEYEASLYEKIGKLEEKLSGTKEVTKKKSINNEIDMLKEKLEYYRVNIRQKNPFYASIVYPQPLTIEEVQKSILKNKNEAILEYFTGHLNLFILIISKENFHVVCLDKENSELTKDILTLRKPLERIGEGSPLIGELKAFNKELAKKLYSELIAPTLPYLNEIKSLIIIPHGCLNYLPFEILISQTNETNKEEKTLFFDFKKTNFFIDDYSISYAPSATAVSPELIRRERKKPIKGDFLGIANPEFVRELLKDQEKTSRNMYITNSLRNKISALPYSEKEVDDASSNFDRSLVYKNRDATEENFTNQSAYYPIIHLSTHGFIDDLHPINSSLIFSYNENLQDVDSLHTYEIFNLDLNCDLVTLSACETALGQNIEKIGGEGVTGLSRAFLYAGARSLIVSLWKVEDESTAILMSEFYNNLKEKNMTKVEALRQAKLSLMKMEKKIGNRSLSYSHPFFWAPFILIGESD